MKKLIIALIISVTYANAAPFSSFVSSNLVKLHFEIFNEISMVDEQTAPQDVKELRKKIGLYKIYLDLGIFLYPENNGIKWKKLRSEIDDGYTVYGNFKDLYDISDIVDASDNRNVESLRAEMLEWSNSALRNSNDWREYLAKPLTHGALKIKKKNLPKFLWAQIDYRPKAQDDANEVLYILTDEIFEKAAKDSKKFVKIKTLLKEKDEIFFHDFRKLIRTSLKLVAELPEVERMTNESSKEVLLEMISRIGDINDVLVAYHKTEKKSLAREIDDKWEELKDWIKANDIKDHLEDIL